MEEIRYVKHGDPGTYLNGPEDDGWYILSFDGPEMREDNVYDAVGPYDDLKFARSLAPDAKVIDRRVIQAAIEDQAIAAEHAAHAIRELLDSPKPTDAAKIKYHQAKAAEWHRNAAYWLDQVRIDRATTSSSAADEQSLGN
jgi:hypothetical protein